jgi:hypothetical protein
MALLTLFALTASPCVYRITSRILLSSSRLFPFQQDGKLGFHDNRGTIVIPAKYDGPGPFYAGFFDGAARVTLNGLPLFLDETGAILFTPDPELETAGEIFSDGLLRFRHNGLYGFLNKKGHLVIEPGYAAVSDFSEGLASFSLASEPSLYGYIGKSGNIAVAPRFRYVGKFSGGLARVSFNTTTQGFIDPAGTLVIPAVFDEAADFQDGLAAARTPSGWGFIDTQGRTIIPFQYECAWSFSGDLAAVCRDGKRGYIDKSGNLVIPFKYDQAASFSDGLAWVKNESVAGYISTSGALVLNAPNGGSFFRHGLAPIQLLSTKTAHINKSGEGIVPAIPQR